MARKAAVLAIGHVLALVPLVAGCLGGVGGGEGVEPWAVSVVFTGGAGSSFELEAYECAGPEGLECERVESLWSVRGNGRTNVTLRSEPAWVQGRLRAPDFVDAGLLTKLYPTSPEPVLRYTHPGNEGRQLSLEAVGVEVLRERYFVAEGPDPSPTRESVVPEWNGTSTRT